MAGSAPADTHEAFKQWGGYMFKEDLTATPKLESLLRGIAKCIAKKFEGNEHKDLSPRALASFYSSVGGFYDQLFLAKNPQSVAFIYKNLSCPHSLQPDPNKPNAYSDPVIPALKPRGFIVWQSIQLLLGPEQHVPFLQEALKIYDVRDPDTKEPFPKYIPPEVFPTHPDPRMVSWHNEMSERLQNEARRPQNYRRPTSPALSSDDDSEGTIITTDAAHHFANPLYKNKEAKPPIMRQLTKGPVKVFQGGLNVAQNVYHGSKLILSPNSGRKKSRSRSRSRSREDHYRGSNSRSGEYRSTANTKNRPTSSNNSTPRPDGQGRREPRRTTSPTTSDEEEQAYQERQRKQKLRRHRSQEEQTVRRDLADPETKQRRHYSVHSPSERPSISRNHSYENGGSGRSDRVSDLENQIPLRHGSNWVPSSSRQQQQQPRSGFKPTEQGTKYASQKQYDNPASSPRNRNDYSASLGQQQQSQAYAQGVRWDRRRSPPQGPQGPQRPDFGLRASSVDSRGGRRVSFIDLSKHEDGYMSSTPRHEERSPITPGSRGRSSGASRFTEYRPPESPGSSQPSVQVTPSTLEEWEGLKKTLSGKGSNGVTREIEEPGVFPIVVEPAAISGAEDSHEESTGTGSADGGRRHSVGHHSAIGAGIVNGVKGRRYTVDTPWTKKDDDKRQE